MFEVTVKGDYAFRVGRNRKELQTFEETFTLNATEKEKALSLIQFELLPIRLKAKNKDFLFWHTCSIKEIKDLSPNKAVKKTEKKKSQGEFDTDV